MTEGEKAEAERIVDDFAGISMLLWDGDDVTSEATAKRDRLVVALAAAIEVDEADGRKGLGAALDRLTEALSALRKHDTEPDT